MMSAALLALLAVPAAAAIAVVESGASGRTWAPRPTQAWNGGAPPPGGLVVTVDRAQVQQEVLGFGAAFTDTSAYNAIVFMDAPTRSQFVEALWGASGLQFSIGRVHINSPDYAFQTYNFDNVTDDFALASFDDNVTYDQQRVIPLIRAARAVTAGWTSAPLRLFGSPWSPPGWMKRNGNMINSDAVCLKDDVPAGSYVDTWARYIVRWLAAYEAAGLPMWGLTPQNEPEARQLKFESCAFDVPHYVDWVGQHLGPAVKARFPAINVLAYDHNRLDAPAYAAALYNDSAAAAFTDHFAVHWYDYATSLGLEQLDAIHALSPSRLLLNTEACVLEELVDGWGVAWLYAADVVGGLNHHLSAWLAWNSVLLTGDKFPYWKGGPNHDNTTKFGDPVLFEFNASGTQRLLFQPSYWMLGHVSRFARPGSTVVATSGGATTYADYDAVRAHAMQCFDDSKCPVVDSLPLLTVGFVGAGGVASVVVVNANANARNFSLFDAADARYSASSIPAESVQTYTF